MACPCAYPCQRRTADEYYLPPTLRVVIEIWWKVGQCITYTSSIVSAYRFRYFKHLLSVRYFSNMSRICIPKGSNFYDCDQQFDLRLDNLGLLRTRSQRPQHYTRKSKGKVRVFLGTEYSSAIDL